MSLSPVLRCGILWLGLLSAAHADDWKLKEIQSFSTDSGITPVDQYFDRLGGFVEVDVAGDADGLCATGTERVRFEWQFDRDIGALAAGERLPVNLKIQQVAATPPCNDAIFKRASLTLAGSDGWTAPAFEPGTSALIDSSVFSPATAMRIYGGDVRDAAASTGTLRIGPQASTADRPLAYFLMVAETAGGIVEVAYVYDQRLNEAVTTPPAEVAPE